MTADLCEPHLELPRHLSERTRPLNQCTIPADGEFVLYWVHHAMRVDENPALDVATAASRQLRIPLLVYQELREDTPYASDRHHTFVPEGAADLHRQFVGTGIQFAFHLERRGHRGSHLGGLCERAAAVITDDIPMDPHRGWTEELAATVDPPVICVDTACVAPMQLVGRAYDRAFQFRQATRSLHADRLTRPWPVLTADRTWPALKLPFEPLDFSKSDLASLIGECEIDHSIAPVTHTRGGSAAGYRRWDHFSSSRLSAYAKLRNDPLRDGTSRLSAYLHYGMVSPLRIAREAAEAQNSGADKYLDELLVWREMAYAFCFFRRDHDTVAALPKWAQQTLEEGRSDPRSALYSWERLARAKTGDRLWDAAQRSLLIHGELHNNVRMTWGKALLNWTADPQSALAMIIDLNHRFALDGRDPASCGGILWCLGQFDRPFQPARPVFGTVRVRPTEQHAGRLDLDGYDQHVSRPLWQSTPAVAVIGAGLSGLICARTLTDHGLQVTVYEKSRGAGGRMATRRTAEGDRFNHGAQYFTVRDDRFQRYVDSWTRDGIVAEWNGRIVDLRQGQADPKQSSTPRFRAIPGMNAVCKHLAADLTVQFCTQVDPPTAVQGRWELHDTRGESLGEFDSVVITAPAPQSARLLQEAPALRKQAESVTMNGCWAAMLTFSRSLHLPFDGAFVHDSPLSWIAHDSSSSDEPAARECWVAHASAEWTNEHPEASPNDVLPQLIDAFHLATGSEPGTLDDADVHRWRFSIPLNPLDSRCVFDPDLGIGACGDWCSGPRVEGAFLSGMAMAGSVLRHCCDRVEEAELFVRDKYHDSPAAEVARLQRTIEHSEFRRVRLP